MTLPGAVNSGAEYYSLSEFKTNGVAWPILNTIDYPCQDENDAIYDCALGE